MPVEQGDILRTTINFVLNDGTQFQNVYHHQRAGIAFFSDAEIVTAITTWAQAMYGELVSMTSFAVAERLSFVDKVAFVDGNWEVTENVGVFTCEFTPVGAGDVLPNQVAPFAIFKTERPKTVGRKFLFPPIETAQNAGILTPAALAQMVGYANDAVNVITLAVLNTLVPGVPRTGVNFWAPFVLAVVTDLVGTQRRRRPGEGA